MSSDQLPPFLDESVESVGSVLPGSLGRRAFIVGAAGMAGAAVGATSLASVAHAIEPGASSFVSLPPTRLVDTRQRTGFQRLDATTIRVKVAGQKGVPTGAVAVVMTATGVNTSVANLGRNYVSVFPSGSVWPGTSNLNCQFTGDVVANLVTVKLGTNPKGYVDIRTAGPCEVILDIAGAYVPTSVPVAAGRFQSVDAINPTAGPVIRAIDTRTLGGTPRPGAVVKVNLNGIVPKGASAVVANLTVVNATGRGYCTAYPIGGKRPLASNINLGQGQTRAVGIITKLGFDKNTGVTGINVYTISGAHIVVDVAGFMTSDADKVSGDGLFVPITPVRVLDTRQSPGPKKRLWPGWTRAFTLPAAFNGKAQSIVMNLTAAQTMGPGYFTVYGAQTVRRVVSNMNSAGAGQTVANHVIARASTKGVATFSLGGAHIICDVMGWFTGKPAKSSTLPPIDPPPPAGPLPWTLQVPRMGLGHGVFEGYAKPIVDGGNSWHWTGTGLVGQRANIVTFGHRTSAGGPYRYQHYLQAGDLMYVTTSDRRIYTYRMAAEYLTSKYTNDILAASRRLGGETFALVACTGDKNTMGLSRLPGGSTQWRIVSVFTLVEWADLG